MGWGGAWVGWDGVKCGWGGVGSAVVGCGGVEWCGMVVVIVVAVEGEGWESEGGEEGREDTGR